MAKAKKLPSGQWRTLVYSHTDGEGKRKYKSFTSDTKWESEQMAAEYRAKNKANAARKGLDITVSEALERYIISKKTVLSPATVREYKRSAKNDFTLLDDLKLRDLTQEKIQITINNHAKTKSAKTVYNIHGLLSSVLSMFYPEFKFNTTLPQKQKTERRAPTDDDVKTLIKKAEGTEAELPILLASVGSLRRSEIAELRVNNVTDTGIYVKQAIVQNENKEWVRKGTKSEAGYRFVPLPQEIISKLKKVEILNDDDRIVKLNPNQIYKRVRKAVIESDITYISLHNLRHYYASVLHAIGVPDKYIMQYGGWSTDTVLKNVYQHVMDDKDKSEQEKVISHFADITKGD